MLYIYNENVQVYIQSTQRDLGLGNNRTFHKCMTQKILERYLRDTNVSLTYSFGVVAMEIVSGKSNTKQKGSADHVWLIKWARKLQQTEDIMDIIDPVLEGDFNRKEAERMIKVSLVCTNSSPLLRPTMSEVVQMLEGEIEITQVLSDPGLYEQNFSISKLRGTDTHGSSSMSGLTDQTETTMKSSVSSADLYPLYPESMILNSTVDFSSSAF